MDCGYAALRNVCSQSPAAEFFPFFAKVRNDTACGVSVAFGIVRKRINRLIFRIFEVEQENIIFYFASYLKIAPDRMQIRVVTQRADIDEYIKNLMQRLESVQNELCRKMTEGEAAFVKGLSDNTAVKKRFFITFEYVQNALSHKAAFSDVIRSLSDEVYKAQKFLMQCGLEVIDCDNGMLIELLHRMINKNSSRYIPPGSITEDMIGEVHTREER